MPSAPSTPTTHRITTVSSLKNGTRASSSSAAASSRISFDSNASHSRSTHEAISGSQSTQSSSSRRSFKGRKAFRKTLMLRKTNQQRGEKGPLLRTSFETSDEPVVAPEEREARSSPTGHRPIAPSTPSSTPPAANDAVICKEIPLSHVETVLSVFGTSSSAPLDLYHDVLHVSPDATDREIRIAYFRRGREVLSDSGVQGGDGSSPLTPNLLDPVTRTKFQAVSMAYEILSTPEWKETYLRNGGLSMPQINKPQSSKSSQRQEYRSKDRLASIAEKEETAIPQSPVPKEPLQEEPPPATTKTSTRPVSSLRASSFRRGIRKSLLTGKATNSHRTSSVRWSEHVEELVFDQDPNEHDLDDDEDDEKNDHEEMIRDFLMIGESSSSEVDPKQPANLFSFQDRNSPAAESMASTLSSASGMKKKKPKIVIDSDELENHLKRMDNEAEKHFVQDFFDTFEESMDGILSLVDSFGDTPTKTYRPSKKSTRKASGLGTKGFFARFGRSMSQDSADLEGKKEEKNNRWSATLSSLAGDDAMVKRSKSFPEHTHEQPSAREIVMDSNAASSQSGAMGSTRPVPPSNRAYQHDPQSEPTQTALPPSQKHHYRAKDAATPVSPRALLKSQESQAKRSILPDNSWQTAEKATTSPTKVVAGQLGSPSSVALNDTFFRPISPNLSEASDVLTSRSDQFDLESLAMSELENPFRDTSSCDPSLASKAPSQEPSLPSEASRMVEESFDNSSNTMATSHVSTAPSVKPKKVNISMVPTQNPESENATSKVVTKVPRLSNFSKGSAAGDDVFAGLDETTQQHSLQHNKSPVGLRGQSISLQRSNSMKSDCVSELSESVFQYNLAANPPPVMPKLQDVPAATTQQEDRPGADTPASEVSTATTITSNVASPSRRIRLSRSASTLSSGVDPVSAMDLVSTASMGDGVSVHTVDSAVEASGFFEYFVAYVSAILTECNDMGENGPGFHHDILGLFSREASVHLEKREPPSRVMSTGSSVTSMSQ
jgi:hypothetical protein